MLAPPPAVPPDSSGQAFRLARTEFGALEGFVQDDHLQSFHAFRRSARALVEAAAPLRPAIEPSDALRRVCRAAVEAHVRSPDAARRFLEAHFEPHRLDNTPGSDEIGFLTGYYEPDVEGSLQPSAAFTAPIARRPAEFGRLGPGVAQNPFPERAVLEDRVEAGDIPAVVWLRDWVEVFFIHVQGSARVRLPDGRALRLVYDGRNGQPYTSIGRLLAERGDIAATDMSLDRLKAWIRAHGQRVGEPGRSLMQSNRSYIFFRGEFNASDEGPIGGAGVPLAPLRSIAIDRAIWPYGLPFWIEAELPWRNGSASPFRRLMIAQDTGSAILGPRRADLFFGSGEEAGRRAGDIRHPARFVVLMPRGSAGQP